MERIASEIDELGAAIALERAALARLCARLTGNDDAAEDLAQETLLTAWRKRHTLRNPAARPQWLAGIARNLCRHWIASRRRESAHLALPRGHAGPDGPGTEAQPIADVDLDVELERDELATLLDRALARLPVDTRAALIQRYIEESPHAEIAARLGLSVDAVAMRLSRGQRALRRLLTTEFRHEAAAHGLSVPETVEWQETRIWCPICGQQRLLGRSITHSGEFRLRCFACFPTGRDETVLNIAHTRSDELLGDVTSFKPALSRVMTFFDSYFTHAMVTRSAPCLRCGQRALLCHGLLVGSPSRATADLSGHGIHVRCERCGETADMHLLGLTLYNQWGRRFWQEHPRLRMLPVRAVEADGRAALVTGFESVTDQACLRVVLACDTYELLSIHSIPSCAPHGSTYPGT